MFDPIFSEIYAQKNPVNRLNLSLGVQPSGGKSTKEKKIDKGLSKSESAQDYIKSFTGVTKFDLNESLSLVRAFLSLNNKGHKSLKEQVIWSLLKEDFGKIHPKRIQEIMKFSSEFLDNPKMMIDVKAKLLQSDLECKCLSVHR